MSIQHELNIGLFGFGTVGKGVYEIINSNKNYWKTEYLIDINVVKIAIKNPDKHEDIKNLLYSLEEIVQDDDIHVIIEAIGGEVAYKYLIEAFENGKHVITANKQLVSNHFNELNKKADESEVYFFYEASVASGIPIIDIISKQASIQKITSISGILNGTCNYVLSQMEENYTFNNALINAKENGYAENDPTHDIDGIDAAFKLSILASICSDKLYSLKDVDITGIRNITSETVNKAKSNGKKIKLIATYNPKLSTPLQVKPEIIDEFHSFYNIVGVNNVISIDGSYTGEIVIQGKGAGRYPTANAVIQDIVKLIELTSHKEILKC